jgi:mycothiol synthase
VTLPTPPSDYSARAARLDDLPVIGEVVDAHDTALLGHRDLGASWLEDDLRRPGLDLSSQSWLVSAACGAPAAYAHVAYEDGGRYMEAIGWVHPDHTGRGIGSFLVKATEARAEELARDLESSTGRLYNFIDGPDETARSLLTSFGYQLVRHFWHMEIELSRPLPVLPAPAGIELRPFRPEDAPAVHAALEQAFADHWEWSPTPFEQWKAEETSVEHFDPSLWLIATDGHDIIGVLTARVLAGRGFVNDLGVMRPHRKRGIGAALLARSLEIFCERGFGEVRLNVDSRNETGAVSLYKRAGMEVRRRFDVYQKQLAPE